MPTVGGHTQSVNNGGRPSRSTVAFSFFFREMIKQQLRRACKDPTDAQDEGRGGKGVDKEVGAHVTEHFVVDKGTHHVNEGRQMRTK